MNETSNDKKGQTFRRWFIVGDSRDDIAAGVGVAGGTVTAIVREFEDVMGKANAELLREQAVARRKAGLKSEDVILSAKIVSNAREAGVTPETVAKLSEGVIGLVASTPTVAATPERIVKSAAAVCDMARARGVEVDKIPTLVEEEIKRHAALKAETVDYTITRDQARRSQELALKKRKMTDSSLASFDRAVAILGVNGVQNLDKAARLIERLSREYGWDSRLIISELDSSIILRQKIKEQRQEIAANEIRLTNQATRDAYHRLVENAPVELKANIVSQFNGLSVQEGLPPSTLWVKCLLDIYWYYDNILSFTRWYNQMASEFRDLAFKVRMKRAQLSFTEAQYNERIRERAGNKKS